MMGNERRAALGGPLPLLAAALCVVLVLAACRSGTRDRVRVGWTERGEASWYGHPFHGQRTASGERYDMHMMTAAHRELPMGTVVEVTNLQNDRRVQVRINDRGPHVKERVIDLSYAAARELQFIDQGTTRVRLEVLDH